MAAKVEIDILARVDQAMSGMQKLTKQFVAAFVSVEAFKKIIVGSIQEYIKAEEAQTKLSAAIRITGQQGYASASGLAKFAKELQNTTNYEEEATMASMGLLMQLGGLSERGVKKAIPLLQDFAAAMGMDLESATTLFAKSISGTTNALARYGIQVEKGLSPQEKFDALLGQLSKKFGGFATQMTQTTGGQMKAFQLQVDELKESFGGLLAKGLNPVLEAMNFYAKGLSTGVWETKVAEADRKLKEDKNALIALQKKLADYKSSILSAGKSDEIPLAIPGLGGDPKKFMTKEAAMTDLLPKVNEALETVRRRINAFSEEEKRATATTIELNKSLSDFNPNAISDSLDETTSKLKDLQGLTSLDFVVFADKERVEQAIALRNEILAAQENSIALDKLTRESAEEAFRAMEESAKDAKEEINRLNNQAINELAGNMQMVANAATSFATSLIEGDVEGALGGLLSQVSSMLVTYALTAAAAAAIALNWPVMAFWLGIAGIGVLGSIGGAALSKGGKEDVKGYASGGIVTHPQLAMVGENGPELITPLNGRGAPGGVVVNVYGSVWGTEDLARAVAKRMQRW